MFVLFRSGTNAAAQAKTSQQRQYKQYNIFDVPQHVGVDLIHVCKELSGLLLSGWQRSGPRSVLILFADDPPNPAFGKKKLLAQLAHDKIGAKFLALQYPVMGVDSGVSCGNPAFLP